MSFGRRLELTRRVRELAKSTEFRQAGASVEDRLEGTVTSLVVDRLYLTWALREVAGLEIDGAAADPIAIVEAGPEALCREIISEIKRECGLTDEERKN